MWPPPQVGERPDSVKYVTKKEKSAKECGMNSWLHRLPADATEDVVEAKIKSLVAGTAAARGGVPLLPPLPPVHVHVLVQTTLSTACLSSSPCRRT